MPIDQNRIKLSDYEKRVRLSTDYPPATGLKKRDVNSFAAKHLPPLNKQQRDNLTKIKVRHFEKVTAAP